MLRAWLLCGDSLFQKKRKYNFGGICNRELFRSFETDKTLSYSVSADLVTQWFILYNGTKEVRGSIPTQVVFPPFLGEKREVSGENHGKRTLLILGSGGYVYNMTLIHI